MIIYFGGAEVSSHRKLLVANDVQNVYMSYMGLRRRNDKPWSVEANFPDTMNVMVDSGAFTVNKGVGSDLDDEALRRVATAYEDFIAANAGRVACFTEFDAQALGYDWIKARREDYYNAYGRSFLPVWHADYGLDELALIANQYGRVAVLQTALGDRDLVPVLNSLAEQAVELHGLSMTKKGPMQEIRWHSVGSTSWTSPMRFGDTFVWTGNELKRYTKPYKEQARKRHRTLFTSEGFDPQKIADDDTAEVAKLSLWSWQKFEGYVNDHRASVGVVSVVAGSGSPDHQGGTEETVRLAPAKKRTDYLLMPGFTFDDTELQVTADSQRRCDTCFLKRTCPAFDPGSDCAYQMPLVIKTREDIRNTENALLSMQMQRIAFMKTAEDQSGGYADPNLSAEMDRLARMIKMQREGTAEKFNLSVSASVPEGAPSILEMFGNNVVQAQAVEGPKVVDELIKTTEIYEAEVADNG